MKHLFTIRFFTVVFFCFIGPGAFAQTDTIRLKDKRLLTTELKPALNQYLVYFQNPKNKKVLGFWFWLRDIKKESRSGEKVFTISQRWYGSDTGSYRSVLSVNRESDFAPLFHEETVKGKIRAYNWAIDRIKGADSVAHNTQKDFKLDFLSPNFNWNLDIETFEMLPLAAGKTFAINFYDAGLDPPKYVLYKVTGSETIALLDNSKVDCWKLFTEGEDHGHRYSETYWISKKGHEFLKEEDNNEGYYRYKIKLIMSAEDLRTRFGN